MRRTLIMVSVAAALATAGCQRHDTMWFTGDFDAATASAAASETLVMMDFYTDWCSWCKRLDEDTFSDAAVRSELAGLVALKVNAEKGGEALAERFEVNGYPTLVFTNGAGIEVDRLVGYFPPDKFISEVRRIRTGDTFAACLAKLDEDPADIEALQRTVEGLLERSDPTGAIARVEAFHAASPDQHQESCRRMMFRARTALQTRAYDKAAKIYRRGSDQVLEVPDTIGTANLWALLDRGAFSEDPEGLASALRDARRADAEDLVAIVSPEVLPDEDLMEVADFAYGNGLYDSSAGLYAKWFAVDGAEAEVGALNRVAWRLYLMGREVNAALAMARRAYEVEESPDVADTIARLLYVTGDVQEAIAIEAEAAAEADDKLAAEFREVIELMKAGADLGDRPGFDYFPGERDSGESAGS